MKAQLFVTVILILSAQARGQAGDLRQQAGCGPEQARFSVKVVKQPAVARQPDPGRALVYVIVEEPASDLLKVGDVTTRVGLDGAWQGANHGPSYLAFAADPGPHQLCTDWQSGFKTLQRLGSAAELVAEPGATYYYRVELNTGRPEYPPSIDLQAVDAAEGRLLLSKAGSSSWKVKH